MVGGEPVVVDAVDDGEVGALGRISYLRDVALRYLLTDAFGTGARSTALLQKQIANIGRRSWIATLLVTDSTTLRRKIADDGGMMYQWKPSRMLYNHVSRGSEATPQGTGPPS